MSAQPPWLHGPMTRQESEGLAQSKEKKYKCEGGAQIMCYTLQYRMCLYQRNNPSHSRATACHWAFRSAQPQSNGQRRLLCAATRNRW